MMLAETKPLINVLYPSGFYGNFLRFFIEKFSKKCADVIENPFLPGGFSHNNINTTEWSGLFERYHPERINDLINDDKNIPICLIIPKNLYGRLLAKTIRINRNPDPNYVTKLDDIYKFTPDQLHSNLLGMHQSVCDFYGIKEKNFKIPKALVRDWFKLEWYSDYNDTYDGQYYQNLLSHRKLLRQRLMIFPLESFLKWHDFKRHLEIIDKFYGTDLDYNRAEEMKELFDTGLGMDHDRQAVLHCEDIIDTIDKNYSKEIKVISVVHEAFIAFHIEKKIKNFIFPFVDKFYTNTKDMIRVAKYFPEYYKIENPHVKNKKRNSVHV